MTGPLRPRTKNQHYVPQVYLSNFCNSDGNIYVFDKLKRRSFRTTPRNIASEGYFYDIPPDMLPPGSDDQFVEKHLASIEGRFRRALTGFLTEASRGMISDDYMPDMAYYLYLQWVRTKRFRDSFVQMDKQSKAALASMIDQMVKSGAASSEARAKAIEKYGLADELRSGDIPARHALHIFDDDFSGQVVGGLLRNIWILAQSKCSSRFFTSDGPVVMRPHKTGDHLSRHGILAESIEVVFPLTPKYALIVCDSKYHHAMQQYNRAVFPVIEEEMLYYNSLQLEQSRRFIYSRTDEFNLAEVFAKDYPELCDPDRDVVTAMSLEQSLKTFGRECKVDETSAFAMTAKERAKEVATEAQWISAPNWLPVEESVRFHLNAAAEASEIYDNYAQRVGLVAKHFGEDLAGAIDGVSKVQGAGDVFYHHIKRSPYAVAALRQPTAIHVLAVGRL